jgi:hypothetical protein
MAAAILYNNRLFRSQYFTPNTFTVNHESGGAATDCGILNLFDENVGTCFKIDVKQGQASTTIGWPYRYDAQLNGFGIYGHNLRWNQGIKVEVTHTLDPDPEEWNTFTDTGIHYPPDNLRKPFAVKGVQKRVAMVRITTLNWDADSYISIMSMGLWISEDVNLAAPFVPPTFQPIESIVKRNNQGRNLPSVIKKVPQKLKINLINFTEEKMVSKDYTRQYGWGFARSLMYSIAEFPFFFMYNDNEQFGTTEQNSGQDRVWYCSIDGVIKQPRYKSPTLIDWKIDAKGYLE